MNRMASVEPPVQDLSVDDNAELAQNNAGELIDGGSGATGMRKMENSSPTNANMNMIQRQSEDLKSRNTMEKKSIVHKSIRNSLEESKTNKSRKLIGGLEGPQDETELQMETMSMKNKMLSYSDKPEITHGGMNKHTTERYDRNGVEIRNKRERQPNG